MIPFKAVAGICLSSLFLADLSYATFLQPSDFLTDGNFSSQAGNYLIDTNTLQMTGPNGFQSPGVLSDGIAVFAFEQFSLGSGASLRTIGQRPAAILSTGSISIDGNGILVFSGGGSGGEPRVRGEGPGGGFPGFNFFGGPGGGGGFGGRGGRGHGNDPTFDFPGAGGPTYGDLATLLEGGSGGGGGRDNVGFQSAGGDGGGALELGAVTSIDILSSINANGQAGQPRGNNHTAGGGGSGGGLRLHAPIINNYGTISANGGRGGDGVFENGGGGGGGRILIHTSVDGFANFGNVTVSGGGSPSDFFGTGSPGQAGVIRIIPEPRSLLLFSFCSLALCIRRTKLQ